MKNFRILSRIGVNGNVPTQCEFRLHDGQLFWHGCPKKFGQTQYAKFIWPNNANLGAGYDLSVDEIKRGVTTYLMSGIFGRIKDINFAEFSEVEAINEKTSKFSQWGLTGAQTPASAVYSAPTHEPTPTPEPVAEPVSMPEPIAEPIAPTPTPEPMSEPVVTPEPTPNIAPEPIAPAQPAGNDIAAAFAALTPLFSGVQANVQAAVMAQIQPLLDELKIAANKQARQLVVTAPNGTTNTVSGVMPPEFDAIVQTVAEGVYVYLHGPAGCGKSYMAEKVAEALGLQFYAMQQVFYEHQVVGFVDANGTRHETPFSEAYQHGGLVLLDEFDGSSEEAAVTFNNALANGVINLPGLGNVKKHPDFRCIAAGNTGMTGADINYTARRVLDASTKDRFFFVPVDYCEAVEQSKANYDDEIVNFVHDARKAIKAAGLSTIVSYRAIEAMANKNMQAAWGDVQVLRGALSKELGPDECRLIYSRLENKNNRWAIALAELAK